MIYALGCRVAHVRRAVVAGCATFVLLAPLLAQAQTIELVPGSTAPRVQLTGEHFQIQGDSTYFSTATRGATLSRYGVLGTDLGYPLIAGNRILFFFGDTVGAYRSGDRYYASRGAGGVGDSIGYLSNTDFSACRYISEIADQLARGVTSPSADGSTCPSLSFFLNPLRAADDHVFKPFVISGLDADESQGTFRVPTSVLLHNDRAYVFATTKMQEAQPTGGFWLQSVAAKSDQSPTLWSDTNPPTFTKLYTVSSHPAVADPANPPRVEGEGGRFMGVPAVVMDAGTIADHGLARFLPTALRSTDVAFLFGVSWRMLASNLYLAAFAMRDIDAGPAKWFYYAGNNRWSTVERDAAPLLDTDDLSQHSVTWNRVLGRFVLMRGATRRIAAQFSTTPWGPWSSPITVFSRTDDWYRKLLHTPGADRIVQSLVPIYNRDGSQVAMPDSDRGTPYAPNVIDKYTENADGSVTLYYTLSTWNPYQVFLMSSTFRPARPR
jgi:hypothetical protein